MYLGNTALVVQEDHYCPFGMRLGGMSSDTGQDYKFLYNGKELDDENNVPPMVFELMFYRLRSGDSRLRLRALWYHYGVRFYDPQLGRWHAMDPADEFHSPYVYCYNDPVNFVDPDGAKEESKKGEKFHKKVIRLGHEQLSDAAKESHDNMNTPYTSGFTLFATLFVSSGDSRGDAVWRFYHGGGENGGEEAKSDLVKKVHDDIRETQNNSAAMVNAQAEATILVCETAASGFRSPPGSVSHKGIKAGIKVLTDVGVNVTKKVKGWFVKKGGDPANIDKQIPDKK